MKHNICNCAKGWIRSFTLLICIAWMYQPLCAQTDSVHGKKINGIAIKTNLLYDGAMIPNIGVEFIFPQLWSLNASWNTAWWSNDAKHRYWRTYGGEIEARKWFGRKAHEEMIGGHHAGALLMGGMYDFEWGHTGYQSNLYLGIGGSYGYAVKLTKHLSLDFVIGLGCVGSTYYKYKPQNEGYCVLEKHNACYVGPVKAEVSFVWVIGDFTKSKKGGQR